MCMSVAVASSVAFPADLEVWLASNLSTEVLVACSY